MSASLPLIKTIHTPLAKSFSISIELTVAASTIDPAIQKKTFRSDTTALIFSNRKVNDIMKIVTSLKESVLLITVASKTIKNEVNEQ